MRYKLNDTHPFMEKINKLYDIMDEMNIEIRARRGNSGLIITDREKNKEYDMRDVDGSEFSTEFPSSVEFKLTYDE